MLSSFFHRWERRLASATTDRVVRPFDWGLDWIPPNGHREDVPEPGRLSEWVAGVMSDTDAFFTPPPTTAYRTSAIGDGTHVLAFPSAFTTPHRENNTVYCRHFVAKRRGRRSRAAVLVLPQWNSGPLGHVGLCRLLN